MRETWYQLSVLHPTFRSEDLLAQALRLVDVKCRVRRAIYLQGAIDGFTFAVEAAR
jgi:hypothetical protein